MIWTDFPHLFPGCSIDQGFTTEFPKNFYILPGACCEPRKCLKCTLSIIQGFSLFVCLHTAQKWSKSIWRVRLQGFCKLYPSLSIEPIYIDIYTQTLEEKLFFHYMLIKILRFWFLLGIRTTATWKTL